ncbi:MAG: hypothetical protein K2R98_07640 [Gemmataceae bacterium]|nr:hypothetical protein [Gemmataceae bacterium]
MRPRMIKVVTGIFVVGMVACLAGSGWYLYRIANRPTMDKNGGTVLVYEYDTGRIDNSGFKPEELTDALKRRLDPTGDHGITVKPLEFGRVEIGIPRDGDHADRIASVKQLVAQVGHLEFRIVANEEDDQEAIAAARAWIESPLDPTLPEEIRSVRKDVLTLHAEAGYSPSVPLPESGPYETPKGKFTYSWVELGPSERRSLGLDNGREGGTGPDAEVWRRVAADRAAGNCTMLSEYGPGLIYSRNCVSQRLGKAERDAKKYEYFLLLRDPLPGKEATGAYFSNIRYRKDVTQKPSVEFTFNAEGGNRFYDLTSANVPTGSEGNRKHRFLAIILDDQVMSAPRLQSAIRDQGVITGHFTEKEARQLVTILRAGALPASLKPLPVSEITLEPKKN